MVQTQSMRASGAIEAGGSMTWTATRSPFTHLSVTATVSFTLSQSTTVELFAVGCYVPATCVGPGDVQTHANYSLGAGPHVITWSVGLDSPDSTRALTVFEYSVADFSQGGSANGGGHTLPKCYGSVCEVSTGELTDSESATRVLPAATLSDSVGSPSGQPYMNGGYLNVTATRTAGGGSATPNTASVHMSGVAAPAQPIHAELVLRGCWRYASVSCDDVEVVAAHLQLAPGSASFSADAVLAVAAGGTLYSLTAEWLYCGLDSVPTGLTDWGCSSAPAYFVFQPAAGQSTN
jgi:hypothetical protein